MQPMHRRTLLTSAAGALAALPLAACGGSGESNAKSTGGATSGTIKIAYQKFGQFIQLDAMLKDVKKDFEAANPGSTLELVTIQAAQNDYITKLGLMNKAASTAPDLMYEDTFMIRSDVDAGYLMPLDDELAKWSDYSNFVEAAKAAGKADDGKTYGVSMGTDTRGIWYNKTILAQAGVAGDWQPKSWDELLQVAREIKGKIKGVIPLNIYSGKPNGEGSVMQGFEMLLYGTDSTLYKDSDKKWVVGSQGFKDALSFIKTVYAEGLAPTPAQALDTNVGNIVSGQWFPKGKLAMGIDGSWMPGTWMPKGASPWPAWTKTMGWCGMPTQKGQGEGKISMSGGWTIAMGSNCQNPDLAFKVMEIALSKKYALQYYIDNSQISVRTDCSDDPKYLGANPSVKFFTDLVSVTKFRPATSDYPNISNAIAVAMEAVMTGQSSVDAAASAYDKAVIAQVGKDNTVQG